VTISASRFVSSPDLRVVAAAKVDPEVLADRAASAALHRVDLVARVASEDLEVLVAKAALAGSAVLVDPADRVDRAWIQSAWKR
jgi:hypothetical protein